MFEESIQHLSKDKHLGQFIKRHGPLLPRREHSNNVFRALAESIVYQQLSGKAAAVILKRFVSLFPLTSQKATKGEQQSFPTPQQVLAIKIEKLRSAGLSNQKATYLKDLAAKFKEGTVSPRGIQKMSDEEVIVHVTKVKGVGVWTAQMFLMFTLGRPDVLPVGDLGIQKGFKKLFKLKTLPTPAQMERLSKNWAGHRSAACFYLWRLLDEK